MLNKQPSDTDLINEMVRSFGENQEKLAVLVRKVQEESLTNLDPIAQSKLRELRSAVLIEDLKSQEQKIEMISNVLKSVCLPTVLPSA